jgi:hypothetical protein
MARGAIRGRYEGLRPLFWKSVVVTCQFNQSEAALHPGRAMQDADSSDPQTCIFRGLNLPDPTNSVEGVRGGFWRRALAVFIDLIAISAVLQVAALVLFPLTNGHVQFSGGPLHGLTCQKLASVPKGVSIPPEFNANSITDCQQSLLGLPTARTLRVSRITRDGAVTKVAQIRQRLDADGQPTPGLPLDLFVLPLLIAVRFALDRIGGSLAGGSLGRRICRIRLSNGSDGQYPPPTTAVSRRYAALALPLAPAWIWSAYAALFPGQALLGTTPYWLFWAGTGIPLLIAALVAADSIIRRRDAFYDRFAGTRVLRLDRKNAGVAMAAVAPPSSLAGSVPSDPELAAQASTVLPPQALRARHYLVRHWRGELSLPVSYWLNGTVSGVVVGFMIGGMVHLINWQGDAEPVVWLSTLIASWILAALLTIWQAVGIWRSAIRYRQSGKDFWGGVAQMLTVAGVLLFPYNFASVGAPQLVGIYEIVSGDAHVGPHEFHVLANGQTLEFSGGITFGVTQELERFLNAMAGVRTVRLNSNGGRILEAQRMSDLISSRNLATFVARDCLSACTIVFLGGKERYMLPAARLGFHQPAFRGMTVSDRRAAIAAEQQRLRHRFGLSAAFAARANSAPPGGMWYPDKDELMRERVVTRLVSPRQVGPSPTDAANFASSSADSAAVATVAARPVPAIRIPGIDDPTVSVSAVADAIARAKIPAELPKHRAAQPRKPALAAK